jgi:hypothetical protein
MDFFDLTLDGQVEGALRETAMRCRNHELRQICSARTVDATRAWRHYPSNVLAGRGAVEIVSSLVARACPTCPTSGDGVTSASRGRNAKHDFRRGGITGVHAMDAEECPDRATAEELVAIKTVTPRPRARRAFDSSARCRCPPA